MLFLPTPTSQIFRMRGRKRWPLSPRPLQLPYLRSRKLFGRSEPTTTWLLYAHLIFGESHGSHLNPGGWLNSLILLKGGNMLRLCFYLLLQLSLAATCYRLLASCVDGDLQILYFFQHLFSQRFQEASNEKNKA